MVHIINSKSDMVGQMLEVIPKLYSHLDRLDSLPTIYYKDFPKHCVPILSGGGSGHEPAHLGYVGRGMLAAAIAGSLFTPPKSSDIFETICRLDNGKGVFLIIKNFEADLIAFSTAIKQARTKGIDVRYIISHDDISVETTNFQIRHRGVTGTILLHKILGEASLAGASIHEIEQIALQLAPCISTLGVASKAATIPHQESPMFSLPAKHISFGIGIHGEAGYKTVPFESSELLAIELINKLQLKFHWKEGDEYILLINNLGATSEIEEYVFTNDVLELLALEGLTVSFIKTGHLMTSLDMAGLSITLCPVKDKRWIDYLKSETDAFAW